MTSDDSSNLPMFENEEVPPEIKGTRLSVNLFLQVPLDILEEHTIQ